MIYSKMLSISAVIAATLSGTVVTAPPAFGKTRPVVIVAIPSDAPTRRVTYLDLNLASVTGERTLNRRVGRAVISVCNESVGPSPIVYAVRACREFAWDGARPQIGRAVQRARDIALTGASPLAAAAITIAIPE